MREHLPSLLTHGVEIDARTLDAVGWTVSSFDDVVTLKQLGYEDAQSCECPLLRGWDFGKWGLGALGWWQLGRVEAVGSGSLGVRWWLEWGLREVIAGRAAWGEGPGRGARLLPSARI